MMGPRDASRERGGAGTLAWEGPQFGQREGCWWLRRAGGEGTEGWAGLLTLQAAQRSCLGVSKPRSKSSIYGRSLMFHVLVELFWPWSGCLEKKQFPYRWELPARCLALGNWHTQHGHQTFHFLFASGPLTQCSGVGCGFSQASGSQDLDRKQFLQVTFHLLSSFCKHIGFLFLFTQHINSFSL